MVAEIDLHGLTHEQARNKVEERLLLSSIEKYFECDIITGKSTEMQKIVLDLCEQYEFDYYIDPNNTGKITVSDILIF